MSQFYQYNSPAPNSNGVAELQPVPMGKLILNGKYADPVTNTVNFIGRGFIPQITLSSTSDLSIANFTITGTQNGVSIIETITGPTANTTVSTNNFFDIVTSISSDTFFLFDEQVIAGSGAATFFPIILINTEKRISNVEYAINFIVNGGAKFNFFGSLVNVAGNGQTYLSAITDNMFVAFPIENNNNSQLVQFTEVYKNILVGQSVLVGTPTLMMQFLQL